MRLMNTPREVDLCVTTRCNLRCKYCSHFSSASDVGKDLPTEEWLKFFEELNRCSVLKACIGGGEPLCREDFPELVEGILKNKMRYDIMTNGTLITDELASFLASTKRCDSIQVSIDGSNSAVHDTCRGEGSFVKAIAGLKLLQKYSLPVTVRVTVHKDNLADLDNIAEFLLEEMKLPGFSTNSASYMGLCRQNAEQLMLAPEERSFAMRKLLDLSQKYNNRITAQAGPLSEAYEWLQMTDARRKGQKSIQDRGFLSGCGVGGDKLAVRPDGTIVPCFQLPHIELGRINQVELKDVWQNHPELKRLRERNNIPLSDFEFCRGCEYINFCTGNCPALAYTICGDENHPSPDACLKRFLEAGGRLLEKCQK